MKKIIILTAILFESFLAKADIIVTRENRGIFGYKSVTELQAEGMHTLNCSDPGRTGCRSSLVAVPLGDIFITADEMSTIDRTVESFILNNSQISGNFIFSDKCRVRFHYNVEKDKLTYTISNL